MTTTTTRHFGSIKQIATVLLPFGAACLLAAGGANAAPSNGSVRVHLGTPVKVGNGTARVQVVEDGSGKPTSVAIVLSAKALDGLPAGSGGHAHEDFEYALPMPEGAPKTGYDHATLNWNPSGHDPEGIYSTPHFDFHFYLIDTAKRNAITFKGAEGAAAAHPPAPELVPTGFVVPPDTAIERMGVHGVDPSGPEFRGKPFTATFIWGYYKGETVFVEPMVAKAFLEQRPDVTLPVRQPAATSHPGYFPQRYRVAFDATRDVYVVALTRLSDAMTK